jgi:hypothetical protein
LLDFFDLFSLCRALLLLLVSELVEELPVVGLGHTWATTGSLRISRRLVDLGHVGAWAACQRVVSGGWFGGIGTFEADFDPGTRILAVAQIDPLHLEVFVAELGQVKFALAKDSTCFITGNGQIWLK